MIICHELPREAQDWLVSGQATHAPIACLCEEKHNPASLPLALSGNRGNVETLLLPLAVNKKNPLIQFLTCPASKELRMVRAVRPSQHLRWGAKCSPFSPRCTRCLHHSSSPFKEEEGDKTGQEVWRRRLPLLLHSPWESRKNEEGWWKCVPRP